MLISCPILSHGFSMSMSRGHAHIILSVCTPCGPTRHSINETGSHCVIERLVLRPEWYFMGRINAPKAVGSNNNDDDGNVDDDEPRLM